jgi:pimeloyl-ACP methyl ester carboxylesterase
MCSKAQWRTLMECMRGAHRLIAIDLHGYGESAMPASREGFSLSDEMRLVEAALKQALEPGARFHLVGHSYGGCVALRFAYAHPERVRSLTLYEPTALHLLAQNHPALAEVMAVAQTAEAALGGGDLRAATARFIDFWSGAGAFSMLSADKQAALSHQLMKVTFDFHAIFNEPLTLHDYQHINIPTCLIAGGDSPSCAHAVIAALAAVLPNHCWVELVGADHMAPVVHPELVNPIIQEFIDRLDSPHLSIRPGSGVFKRQGKGFLHDSKCNLNLQYREA